jgi:hypothetical protein
MPNQIITSSPLQYPYFGFVGTKREVALPGNSTAASDATGAGIIKIAVAVSMTTEVAVVVLTYKGVSIRETGSGRPVPTEGAAVTPVAKSEAVLLG